MADDQNGDGKGAPGFQGRSRPPQTIDLQAEDVTPPEPARARHRAEESTAQNTVADNASTQTNPREQSGATDSDTRADDTDQADQSKRIAPGSPPWGAAGAIGGLAALLLVLALAAGLWSEGVFDSNAGALAALRKRVDALESQQKTLAARPQVPAADAKQLQALDRRVAALEAKAEPPQRTDVAPPGASPGTIADKVKALEGTTATLGHRLDEEAAATREARGRSEAALGTATAAQDKASDTASTQKDSRQDIARDIAPLQDRLAALESTAKQISDSAARKSTALSDRIAAMESGFKQAKDRFERQDTATAGILHAMAALQALRAAVERGTPYARELDTAKPFAPDAQAIAPLARFAAKGLPSRDALTHDFDALAPALSQTIAPKAEGDGILDRLQASAERLVRVRPAGDVQGDTPGDLLARAQARVAAHDLAGAAAALEKLPAAPRAPAQSWIDTVKARAAALDALQRLAVAMPAADAAATPHSTADDSAQEKSGPHKPDANHPAGGD